MNAPLDILHIEDDDNDALLFATGLRESLVRPHRIRRTASLQEGLAALATCRPDVAFVDFALPDAQGVAAIQCIRGLYPDLPLVALTSLDDTSIATRLAHLDVDDYIVKAEATGDRIQRVLALILQRRANNAASRLGQGHLRALADTIPQALIVLDVDARQPGERLFLYASAPILGIYGAVAADFSRDPKAFAARVHPEDVLHVATAVSSALDNPQGVHHSFRIRRPDGSYGRVEERLYAQPAPSLGRRWIYGLARNLDAAEPLSFGTGAT